MTDGLTIGSRGSKLALIQSEWVKAELNRIHPGLSVDITVIKTTGDEKLEASLTEIGGKGAFTEQLEQAMLDGRCDMAVHSLKDLPTSLPEGLRLGCTPPRENVEDALVFARRIDPVDDAAPLAPLNQGASVGTSSLRRKAQLLALRPDLKVIELRGNVETRLRKLAEGQADAVILAAAGLKRLGMLDHDRVPQRVDGRFDALRLTPPGWLPAVGQGALGIEVRTDDHRLLELLAPLHDSTTWAATACERAFLNRLGAGCMAPVGALALVPQGSTIRFHGRVLSGDGGTMVERAATGEIDSPEALGKATAEWCIQNGAEGLL